MRAVIGAKRDTALPIMAFLEHESDIDLIGVFGTASELLSLVSGTALDVVVLDLMLDDGDALSVLDALALLGDVPTTVVLSCMTHDRLLQALAAAGAAYVLAKPVDPALLCDRIRRLAGPREAAGPRLPVSPPSDGDISRLLTRVGVPTHLFGHRYLRLAIKLAVEDESVVHAITKEIYPVVAHQCKTSAMRVERTIRHAIEVAWTRGQPEYLHSLFGNTIRADRGKPTNSEFVARLADHIQQARHRINADTPSMAGD